VPVVTTVGYDSALVGRYGAVVVRGMVTVWPDEYYLIVSSDNRSEAALTYVSHNELLPVFGRLKCARIASARGRLTHDLTLALRVELEGYDHALGLLDTSEDDRLLLRRRRRVDRQPRWVVSDADCALVLELGSRAIGSLGKDKSRNLIGVRANEDVVGSHGERKRDDERA
jgi:hypothetical protein